MKIRIALTILIAVISLIIMNIYNALYSPLAGVTTAAQLNDTLGSYALATMVQSGTFVAIGIAILILLLGMIWWKPLWSMRRKAAVILGASLLGLSSCAPYKTLDVVEIQSNETAWAIPLDAMSQDGQVKFNSVDFLNQKKVASKRIMVDKVKRSTGRTYMDIEWIPAVRVIRVDRSLITAQWSDGKADDNRDDYGIGVVTADSVKLRVGLTLTCSIDEDDASTYLYYHGDRKLIDVMNQNVRSYAIAELTREYSKLNLSEAQTKGEAIYRQLESNAKAAFKPKGVTIHYLGNAEGLTYGDPNVQAAINRTYLAEQDAKTAEAEQIATKTRNATLVMNAQAEADAARKLMEAKEAALFKNDLNIRTMNAESNLTMARKWSGNMPASIIPSNSPLLMNLGSK